MPQNPPGPVTPVPLGELIRWLMSRRPIDQTGLAEEMGVSLKHVNRVINGHVSPSVDFLHSLATRLGVSPQLLVAAWLTDVRREWLASSRVE